MTSAALLLHCRHWRRNAERPAHGVARAPHSVHVVAVPLCLLHQLQRVAVLRNDARQLLARPPPDHRPRARHQNRQLLQRGVARRGMSRAQSAARECRRGVACVGKRTRPRQLGHHVAAQHAAQPIDGRHRGAADARAVERLARQHPERRPRARVQRRKRRRDAVDHVCQALVRGRRQKCQQTVAHLLGQLPRGAVERARNAAQRRGAQRRALHQPHQQRHRCGHRRPRVAASGKDRLHGVVCDRQRRRCDRRHGDKVRAHDGAQSIDALEAELGQQSGKLLHARRRGAAVRAAAALDKRHQGVGGGFAHAGPNVAVRVRRVVTESPIQRVQADGDVGIGGERVCARREATHQKLAESGASGGAHSAVDARQARRRRYHWQHTRPVVVGDAQRAERQAGADLRRRGGARRFELLHKRRDELLRFFGELARVHRNRCCARTAARVVVARERQTEQRDEFAAAHLVESLARVQLAQCAHQPRRRRNDESAAGGAHRGRMRALARQTFARRHHRSHVCLGRRTSSGVGAGGQRQRRSAYNGLANRRQRKQGAVLFGGVLGRAGARDEQRYLCEHRVGAHQRQQHQCVARQRSLLCVPVARRAVDQVREQRREKVAQRRQPRQQRAKAVRHVADGVKVEQRHNGDAVGERAVSANVLLHRGGGGATAVDVAVSDRHHCQRRRNHAAEQRRHRRLRHGARGRPHGVGGGVARSAAGRRLAAPLIAQHAARRHLAQRAIAQQRRHHSSAQQLGQQQTGAVQRRGRELARRLRQQCALDHLGDQRRGQARADARNAFRRHPAAADARARKIAHQNVEHALQLRRQVGLDHHRRRAGSRVVVVVVVGHGTRKHAAHALAVASGSRQHRHEGERGALNHLEQQALRVGGAVVHRQRGTQQIVADGAEDGARGDAKHVRQCAQHATQQTVGGARVVDARQTPAQKGGHRLGRVAARQPLRGEKGGGVARRSGVGQARLHDGANAIVDVGRRALGEDGEAKRHEDEHGEPIERDVERVPRGVGAPVAALDKVQEWHEQMHVVWQELPDDFGTAHAHQRIGDAPHRRRQRSDCAADQQLVD